MELQISAQTEAMFRQRFATGRYASEDELLRDALALLSQTDEDWAAIEEGLVALDHPETWIPLETADAELRSRLQIPPR